MIMQARIPVCRSVIVLYAFMQQQNTTQHRHNGVVQQTFNYLIWKLKIKYAYRSCSTRWKMVDICNYTWKIEATYTNTKVIIFIDRTLYLVTIQQFPNQASNVRIHNKDLLTFKTGVVNIYSNLHHHIPFISEFTRNCREHDNDQCSWKGTSYWAEAECTTRTV